jgi:hypothetical protein
MLHYLPREDQDLDDPAVFINTDIRNAFQEMCRQTSFDTPIGVATQTYDGGRVQPGDTIPTINEIEPFLGYFWAMHNTECTNRFTDHCVFWGQWRCSFNKQTSHTSFYYHNSEPSRLPHVWFCRGQWRCSFNKQTSHTKTLNDSGGEGQAEEHRKSRV